MDTDRPGEVFDISPLVCPSCRSQVAEEDVYCAACGTDLLQELASLCPNCGRAVKTEAAFCPSCGRGLRPDTASTEPAIPAIASTAMETPPIPASEARRTSWRGRRVWIPAAGAVALITIVAAWWFLVRTDYGVFDKGLQTAAALATEGQANIEEISDPGDLEEFADDTEDLVSDLAAVYESASDADGSQLSSALENLAKAQEDYWNELIRLAQLPSAEVSPEEYERAEELRDILDLAFADAKELRAGVSFDVPELSHTPLTNALADLAAYRRQIIKEREEIKKENAARARQLDSVQAFTGNLDGVIDRYSDARMELQDWLDGVRTYGATVSEGYDVLRQNVDLRTQIRTELAALQAPKAFAGDVQALLGVMDDAIAATGTAVRGIDEYLFSYQYRSVFETPGWHTFQSASDAIGDAYAVAVSDYETHKRNEIRRLSKVTPLPDLPE